MALVNAERVPRSRPPDPSRLKWCDRLGILRIFSKKILTYR